MSFVFQMDVDQKQLQQQQQQQQQQARSPSSPPAHHHHHHGQPRFFVSYAAKPVVQVSRAKDTPSTAAPSARASNPASDAIRKWLAAHQTYLPHDQPSSSFDTDSEDEEEEQYDDEESEDEGVEMNQQDANSSSSEDDEDDSQLIFVRPRRHNNNSSSNTNLAAAATPSMSVSPAVSPRRPTTLPVAPPTTTQSRGTTTTDRPRLMPPIVFRTRIGRTGPAPLPTTTTTTSPLASTSLTSPVATGSPAMTNLLTAARPALPVVSLSAASAVIDLSMPSSHEKSHWSDDEEEREPLEEDNEEEEDEEEDEEVVDDDDEAQWDMEEDEVPSLDVDEEGAPASTSTQSLPIPILSINASSSSPLKAQGPHISHLRRNRFIRGQQLYTDDDDDDNLRSDDGIQHSYYPHGPAFDDEDMWDTSYQSPPTRKSTRQTYNIVHQDGQNFYGPWMQQYFTGVRVAHDS